VEVDLMQPLDAEKKPAVHATPLNHVGLWVDDLPKAMAWLTAQGVRFAPGGIRKGAAGYDICFLHPKASEEFPIAGEGVLIELVQAPPEVVEGYMLVQGGGTMGDGATIYVERIGTRGNSRVEVVPSKTLGVNLSLGEMPKDIHNRLSQRFKRF
jgi:hypothetical protein